MRITLAIAAFAMALGACSPMSSTGPVSQSTATRSALKEVQRLELQSAEPHISGFEVTKAFLSTSVSQASDSYGHLLTVSPSVSEAWVVEFLAPAQVTWSATPAIVIVDASTGGVRAAGLWKVPLDAPTK